jgi:hypothetical protein
MGHPPAIIHLIGHPAVGKYTVAKALVAAAADAGTHHVLMDNHATGNVILPLLDLSGLPSIPDEVWDRVGEVREVVYGTIADMSPPEWSYVFTNVLIADDPREQMALRRVAKLADDSRRRYVPVRLTCEIDVHLTRVASPERGGRHKWTDVDAVERFLRRHEVIDLSAYESLVVDTTNQSPEQSAVAILRHLDTVGNTIGEA